MSGPLDSLDSLEAIAPSAPGSSGGASGAGSSGGTGSSSGSSASDSGSSSGSRPGSSGGAGSGAGGSGSSASDSGNRSGSPAGPVIVTRQLTKDYGNSRGIFDVDLEVYAGEVFGYIGTNGAGKTTTIRSLVGFAKPDAGSVTVWGLDPWKDSARLMNHISYIPGEINFPALATGTAFLKAQAEFLHIKDYARMNDLIAIMQLDPSATLKRMSKGMKQKTAIVAALMAEKQILILDEPTTGLDPLMRDAFLDLIQREKEKGTTVFMSSHIFDEMESVCDRVAMIREGKIIGIVDIEQLHHGKQKTFDLSFAQAGECQRFLNVWLGESSSSDPNQFQCTVEIASTQINQLFACLRNFELASVTEQHLTLERVFMDSYKRETRP